MTSPDPAAASPATASSAASSPAAASSEATSLEAASLEAADSAAEWRAWLDRLEAAAGEFAERLAAGEAPVFPDLPRPCARPVPPALVPRGQATLARVGALITQVAARRDAIAAELATLPRPSRDRRGFATDYALGNGIDLRG